MISMYPYGDLGLGPPRYWVEVNPALADANAGTVVPVMGAPTPPPTPQPEPPIPPEPQPIPRQLVLTASWGTYAVSGQAVNLIPTRPRTVIAARGTYAVTGQSMQFLFKRRIVAVRGNYTVSGQTMNFLRARKLNAVKGSYALTGQAVTLTKSSTGLDSPAFFVATTGNNANPGTQAQPWQTLQYAADHAVAGRTMYIRGGTYAQATVSLSVSGTSSSNMVKWKPEPGTGTVTIRNSTAVNLGNNGIIEGYGVSYNRFEGLTFGGASGSKTAQAIKLASTSDTVDFNTTFPDAHHNEVINCTFSNIGHDGSDTSAFFGTIFFAYSQDDLADGNTIDNCYGMMIRTAGTWRTVIRNNTMTNLKAAFHYGVLTYPKNQHGVWVADNYTGDWSPGSTVKKAGYHAISGNIVDGAQDFETSGIRLDTGGHNAEIYNNIVRNLTNANAAGIFMESRVNNNLIHDNLVYNVTRGLDTADPSIGTTNYNSWINNTIYGGEICISLRNVASNFIANNICVGASRTQILASDAAVGHSNVFKNNLYYKSGSSNIATWNAADASLWGSAAANRTLSSWASVSGETGGVNADPNFIDAAGGNFQLNAGSPAIDVGQSSLNTATITYSRSYSGSAPDIGKYESSGLSTTTVIIGDGSGVTFAGCEDGTLDQGAPTVNKGSLDTMTASKYDPGEWTHIVIKFSGLSNITPPVTVISATLSLYQTANDGSATYTIDARRLLRNWVEGQATWNIYSTGNNWGTAGAQGNAVDRIATVSGSGSVGPTLNQYYSITGLAADVQGFINGTLNNYGWILERSDAGDDFKYKYFVSSDNVDTTTRPYLTVVYTSP